jgi:hypothetical protein
MNNSTRVKRQPFILPNRRGPNLIKKISTITWEWIEIRKDPLWEANTKNLSGTTVLNLKKPFLLPKISRPPNSSNKPSSLNLKGNQELRSEATPSDTNLNCMISLRKELVNLNNPTLSLQNLHLSCISQINIDMRRQYRTRWDTCQMGLTRDLIIKFLQNL